LAHQSRGHGIIKLTAMDQRSYSFHAIQAVRSARTFALLAR